jgi:cyclin-dependent kinase 2
MQADHLLATEVLSRDSDTDTASNHIQQLQARFDALNQRHLQAKRLLGSGGYGTVFLVEDSRDAPVGIRQAELAVKCMRCEVDDPQGLSLVAVREAGILRSFLHPHVVGYRFFLLFHHPSGDVDVLMGMDLCEGGSLQKYIEELHALQFTHMPTEEVRSFTRQLLSAVGYIHDRRVMHRDIKPSNIGLDRERRMLRILDFGLARTVVSPGSNYTGRCTTRGHCAPELMLGQMDYNASMDIWSVACVILQMCWADSGGPFYSETEYVNLIMVFMAFGTPTEETWPGVSSLPDFSGLFPKFEMKTMRQHAEGKTPIPDDVLAVLDGLFRVCPARRLTAMEAYRLMVDGETMMMAPEDEEEEEVEEMDEEPACVGAKRARD